MSNSAVQITDADLHAYVDDQLAPERRAALEAYLLEHPEAAARVRQYREQNLLFQSAYNPVLEEPVPAALTNIGKTPTTRFRYVAVAATFVIGISVGWFLRGERIVTQPTFVSLPAQAALAHVVYASEVLHPVEVGAEQQEHLVKWLSRRLNAEVHAPNLQSVGYQLEGGRLLPGSSGPAAQFMYQDSSGQRLTLYVRTDLTDNNDTAFRYAREGNVSVFYWVDRNVAYALAGETERERLLATSELIYHELNR